MRRRVPLLIAALLMSAAGCADPPAGVDGDLTDDWPPAPAAQQFRPAPGTCHAELPDDGSMARYQPVPCTAEHLTETAAVVDLTDPADAHKQCARRADAFLGADWRLGWVLLQPVLPTEQARAGGARWVRCDVAQTSPVDGDLIPRRASMRAGLRAGAPLRMACANPTIRNEQVTAMRPVTCAKKHRAEFAGLYESKRTRSADVTSAEMAKGCGTAIARFAGIPDDGDVPYRVGWLGFPPDEAAWKLGDRAIRCFLWLNGEAMTGSYRNAGPAKLKIQYVYR